MENNDDPYLFKKCQIINPDRHGFYTRLGSELASNDHPLSNSIMDVGGPVRFFFGFQN